MVQFQTRNTLPHALIIQTLQHAVLEWSQFRERFASWPLIDLGRQVDLDLLLTPFENRISDLGLALVAYRTSWPHQVGHSDFPLDPGLPWLVLILVPEEGADRVC